MAWKCQTMRLVPICDPGAWHTADAPNAFAGPNLRRMEKDQLITQEQAGEWKQNYQSLGKARKTCLGETYLL